MTDAAGYAKLLALTIGAFALAWILTRHSNHVWQLVPYALLIACPLMHFMHHGRHGRRHADGGG